MSVKIFNCLNKSFILHGNFPNNKKKLLKPHANKYVTGRISHFHNQFIFTPSKEYRNKFMKKPTKICRLCIPHNIIYINIIMVDNI